MDVDAAGCDNECIDIGEFRLGDLFCRGATSRNGGPRRYLRFIIFFGGFN